MIATFVKELKPTVRGSSVCLIELDGKHYAISSIPCAPDHGGPETLAFAADANGEITSYTDLAGGRDKSREETIAQLEAEGEQPYGIADEVPMPAMLATILSPPGPDYYVDEPDSA